MNISWQLILFVGILVLGFALSAISDFIIHRYIWHAKWKFVKWKIFYYWLYPHYVHHYIAHHAHSFTAKEELLNTGVVPDSHLKKKEDRFANEPWIVNSLKCSRHGLSIVDFVCVISYYSLFVLTPHPWIGLLVFFFFGWWFWLLYTIPSFVTIFTQINHKYYHMTVEARAKYAPSYLKWFFTSKEFDRMAGEHLLHHYDSQYADEYYCVYPYGKPFVKMVFGKW